MEEESALSPSELHEKLLKLVDQLPSECAEQGRQQLERPRFVHALLVVPPREGGGELLKASLKRQLDENDGPEPGKELAKRRGSVQQQIELLEKAEMGKKRLEKVEMAKQLNVEMAKHEAIRPISPLLIDAIAEAVRVLRTAREKLDEKLRQLGLDESIEVEMAASSPATVPMPMPMSSPSPSPAIPLHFAPSPPRMEEPRQRPQQRLFSAINFPSELRKYRPVATVNSQS